MQSRVPEVENTGQLLADCQDERLGSTVYPLASSFVFRGIFLHVKDTIESVELPAID